VPPANSGTSTTFSAPGKDGRQPGVGHWVQARGEERAVVAERPADDGVGVREGRDAGDVAVRGQDAHLLAARCGHDDAAADVEGVDDRLEQDPGGLGGPRGLLQAPRQHGERLEVEAPPAQLALVDGREARGHDGHQPEDRAVGQQLLEGRADGRRGVLGQRAQQAALLGVVDAQQHERVPHRELHAGAVRGQQRHRDEVQDDQGAHRAARAARHVGRPGQEDAVDHEHQAEEVRRGDPRQAPGDLDDRGEGQVAGRDAREHERPDVEDLVAEPGRQPDRDHQQHPEALQVAQPLPDRDELAGGGGGGRCAHGRSPCVVGRSRHGWQPTVHAGLDARRARSVSGPSVLRRARAARG
jgi:hypothetical protein